MVSVRLQPLILRMRSRAASPPLMLFVGSPSSCASIAAMGPVQVGTGGKPPVALPWARTIPARAQPIRLESQEPLLKPAMYTCALSMQYADSTADRTASKNGTSGESASLVSKHCPTGLSPIRMALVVDAVCIGRTCDPFPP